MKQWPLGGAVSRLTVQDVPEALGTEQLLQPRHLVLQLPYQFGIGVLVDDSVALDLLGSVRISVNEQTRTMTPNSH